MDVSQLHRRGHAGVGDLEVQGLHREDFPDGLPLNMTIRVFRSHKGDIEKTVLGSYMLRNPSTGRTSEAANFNAKEYAIDEEVVPLKLKDSAGRPIELFDDLVDNGELEVELVCLAPGQYFGMARPDLYLLPREGSFVANWSKGYISIWLQMLLITAFGVMWSTFLNGAVAMLATFATLVMGFYVLVSATTWQEGSHRRRPDRGRVPVGQADEHHCRPGREFDHLGAPRDRRRRPRGAARRREPGAQLQRDRRYDVRPHGIQYSAGRHQLCRGWI